MPIHAEVRLVFRQLRKSPGFTLTAVLMLAFGIGATTAIFSIVDGVLLRPLPFPQADRLVTLGDQVEGTDWGQSDPGPVTGPEVITYARDTRSFESLGGYTGNAYELSSAGAPVQIYGTRMTPSVFTVLAVAPLMGRVFNAQEDTQKMTAQLGDVGEPLQRRSAHPPVPARAAGAFLPAQR